MYKKITDERLKDKNLKNIRIIYVVQTIGIFLILLKDFIAGEDVFGTPLFFVFILSNGVVAPLLQMRISVEHEDGEKKKAFDSLGKVIGISVLIGASILLIYKVLTPDRSWLEASIAGTIVGVIYIVIGSYMVWLRKKSQEE